MTWRSFRDHTEDRVAAITGDWKVIGYPTLYLIDHHGIIRKRWIGGPTPEELTHMTAVLIDAARRNLAPEAMHSVVAALPLSPDSKATINSRPTETPTTPNTGFCDKVFREADGSEVKYVVFVPRDYTGDKTVPAILFLHGAGSRGTDGRRQTIGGLANAIRQKKENFPFLVIFPQARERRRLDAGIRGGPARHRDPEAGAVGVSHRSGSGRAHRRFHGWPRDLESRRGRTNHWSAIVPICHGWKPNQAARLKDLPCWCFHGDADEMIPASQSREMVRAIQEAGGKPLYQEFIGVDHNQCRRPCLRHA